MKRTINYRFLRQLAISVALLAVNGHIHAQDASVRDIARISAGTTVTDTKVEGWSQIVLIASPVVSSGKVSDVKKIIRDYAAKFSTIIAVDTERTGEGYVFLKAGIGMAIKDGDNFVVVSASNTEDSPALGMIARQVLSSSEKMLERVVIPTALAHVIVIDCPAIVLDSGKHVDRLARHFVRVDQQTGTIDSAIWFIDEEGEQSVQENQYVVLPENFRELRKLHVDTKSFFFGIPGERAFAMEALPPGKKFAFTDAAAKIAVQEKLSSDDLRTLEREILGRSN